MHPRVSVAVTNYNGEAYLDACLGKVKAQTVPPDEILVVDDASTDGSLSLLRECHPDVRILQQKENRGPGAARNRALDEARNRFVFQVDNDALPEPDCLERLLATLEKRPGVVIAQARVVHDHDPTRIHYDGGSVHYLGIVALRSHGLTVDEATSDVENVDAVMAVALLIDREALGDHRYDEGFHFYFEDIDFSVRLRLLGKQLVVDPSALVRHREGTADLSFRRERGYPARRAFYFTRNRWRFARKILTSRTLLLGIPALVVYEGAYLLFLAAKGHLGPWLRAVIAVQRERGEVSSLRGEIQATRTLSDRELVGGSRLTFVSPDDNRWLTRWLEGILNAWLRFWWFFMRPLV